MGVTTIESAEQFNKLKKDSNVLVADFYATWCGPCINIAPQVELFSTTYPGVTFVKLDVDTFDKFDVEFVKELGITAMPTFLIYKKGEKVGKVVGANRDALKAEIEKAVAIEEATA